MSRLRKLDELVGSVEALLTLLPANSNPEVQALRDRVDTDIFDAWTSIARDRMKLGEGAQTLMLMGIFVIAAAASFLACRAANLTDPDQPEDDHG